SAGADGAGDRARRQSGRSVPAVAARVAGKPRHLLLQRLGRVDHGVGARRPVLVDDPERLHLAAGAAGTVAKAKTPNPSPWSKAPAPGLMQLKLWNNESQS